MKFCLRVCLLYIWKESVTVWDNTGKGMMKIRFELESSKDTANSAGSTRSNMGPPRVAVKICSIQSKRTQHWKTPEDQRLRQNNLSLMEKILADIPRLNNCTMYIKAPQPFEQKVCVCIVYTHILVSSQRSVLGCTGVGWGLALNYFRVRLIKK